MITYYLKLGLLIIILYIKLIYTLTINSFMLESLTNSKRIDFILKLILNFLINRRFLNER